MTEPIEFIMIGGFLGAGKTTLIANLARRFQADGKHVCVVTNDQAEGLVDTELLKSQGLDVNEVAGSCFCCNFDGLTQAIDAFETRRRPDVILAEPVGSCTDLIATITLPMVERLGTKFVHRPYAVVLKPNHGKKILSGVGGGFSEKAEYIFRKQLEEAEIILVNRIDELSTNDLERLQAHLAEQYPSKRVICLSAKTGENLEGLYEALQVSAEQRTSTMDIDYDVYADGEAELGWLNATIDFESSTKFRLDDLAIRLVDALKASLSLIEAEPGHLKVLCRSGQHVSVANLIDSDSPATLSHASETDAVQAKAIINARVRLDPDELRWHVDEAIAAVAEHLASTTVTTQMESFRPGRPKPTYRTSV